MARASSIAAAALLAVAVALPLAAIPHHYVWREFYVAYALKAGVNSTIIETFETGFNGSMRPGWLPSSYVAPDSINKYYNIRDYMPLTAEVYKFVNGTLVRVLSIVGQPGHGGELVDSLSSVMGALPPADYLGAIYLNIPKVGGGVITSSRRLVAAIAYVRGGGGARAVSMNVPYLYPPNPGCFLVEALAAYRLKTYSPADGAVRASLTAAYPFIAIAAAALLARKAFGRRARAAGFAILAGSAALLAYVVAAEGVGPATPTQYWHDSVTRLGGGATVVLGVSVKAYVGPGGTPLNRLLTPYQLTALKLLSALTGGGRLAVEITSPWLSCNATVEGATYVGHGVYVFDRHGLGSVRVAATNGQWTTVSIIVGVPVKASGLLNFSYG